PKPMRVRSILLVASTAVAMLALVSAVTAHSATRRTPYEVLLGFLGREQRPPESPRSGSAGYFATLPPGTALPGDAECAARVRRDPWEPRPANAAANHTVPTDAQLG